MQRLRGHVRFLQVSVRPLPLPAEVGGTGERVLVEGFYRLVGMDEEANRIRQVRRRATTPLPDDDPLPEVTAAEDAASEAAVPEAPASEVAVTEAAVPEGEATEA